MKEAKVSNNDIVSAALSKELDDIKKAEYKQEKSDKKISSSLSDNLSSSVKMG